MTAPTRRLGVVMDPIESITVRKDTTLALLLEAQVRGWDIHYLQPRDLLLRDGRVLGHMRRLAVQDDARHWYDLEAPEDVPLERLDVILMRKDPPFDIDYVYTTHLLEMAETAGVLVVNRPQSLRDANEKLYAARFPQCTPPTLVTSDRQRLRTFLAEQEDIVVKPLEGMGGSMVFRIQSGDPNTTVILDTMTHGGTRWIMAQRYLPEIRDGDKRILMIDGEPYPRALARIPAEGETRGNLAAGGRGEGVELSERDRWICAQVGPTLRDKGLLFVGLDVIGDCLTEINVTSPTCVRELDRIYDDNISARVFDAIERQLAARGRTPSP